MIIVTGRLVAHEGAETALQALCSAHSARARHEPGCLAHDAFIDPEFPGAVTFVERWVNEAALEAHFRVPESAEFVRQAKTLTAGDAEIHLYDATPRAHARRSADRTREAAPVPPGFALRSAHAG